MWCNIYSNRMWDIAAGYGTLRSERSKAAKRDKLELQFYRAMKMERSVEKWCKLKWNGSKLNENSEIELIRLPRIVHVFWSRAFHSIWIFIKPVDKVCALNALVTNVQLITINASMAVESIGRILNACLNLTFKPSIYTGSVSYVHRNCEANSPFCHYILDLSAFSPSRLYILFHIVFLFKLKFVLFIRYFRKLWKLSTKFRQKLRWLKKKFIYPMN